MTNEYTKGEHTPNVMIVSGYSLWSDTPNHSHVKMMDVTLNSNGVDAEHLSNEFAKRWNCHDELVELLEKVEKVLGNRNDTDFDLYSEIRQALTKATKARSKS